MLKLAERFSDHCLAIKSENLPQSPLLVACEVSACAEGKTFILALFSSPLPFLPHYFSFSRRLVRFILWWDMDIFSSMLLVACVASVFNRVIARKLEWKQKKTNLARKRLLRRLCCLCFLLFPLASFTESYLFLYCLKDLFTLYRLADKFVLDRQDGGCCKR